MKRRPQGDQNQGLARAAVDTWLLIVESQRRLGVAKQPVENVIELGIAVEFVEEVVEVQEDGGVAVLPVVRHILIERLQSSNRKMARCQVSHRPEEVRRKIA